MSQETLSVTLPIKMIEFMKKIKEETGLSVSAQIELRLKGLSLCEKHDIALYHARPRCIPD